MHRERSAIRPLVKVLDIDFMTYWYRYSKQFFVVQHNELEIIGADAVSCSPAPGEDESLH
jgi:hypothetical protein